jgi:hypothetical protein
VPHLGSMVVVWITSKLALKGLVHNQCDPTNTFYTHLPKLRILTTKWLHRCAKSVNS